jgi:N-glycosylase/DNA lyase
VKKTANPITEKEIRASYNLRSDKFKARLREFREVWRQGDDERIWEEMVFCFFTGGCSARMGMRSIDAVRPLLMTGGQKRLSRALTGVHRFPNARARYIVASRKFLRAHCGMRIKGELEALNHLERRDWLVREKQIKGLAYKEASHFLRNIGLPGYAILDKHVLSCMAELKIISDSKPPKTRERYLRTENKLKLFADRLKIDFDEMDLLLWSLKTGEILK